MTASGLPHNAQLPYQRSHPPSHVQTNTQGQQIELETILVEIRRNLEEQKKVKEDVRRIGMVMNRLEERVKLIDETLKEHSESSFTIETSQYKVRIYMCVSVCF